MRKLFRQPCLASPSCCPPIRKQPKLTGPRLTQRLGKQLQCRGKCTAMASP
jgi:hypothetical protein